MPEPINLNEMERRYVCGEFQAREVLPLIAECRELRVQLAAAQKAWREERDKLNA